MIYVINPSELIVATFQLSNIGIMRKPMDGIQMGLMIGVLDAGKNAN
jgi:hypothetical protein